MRRSLTFAPILAVAAATLASPPTSRPAASGSAGLGPELSVSDRLAQRRYVAAGERAYDIGTQAGRYPAMGFHTRGEMGGIWTPPLKLLDGIWFGVNGSWLPPATRFTSGYGYTRMTLPGPPGVQVTRTDFVPDGRRAVLIGLTLSANRPQRIRLTVAAHSELLSAYPWGTTTPSQLAFNLPDTASTRSRQLVFREVGRPPVANARRHDWAAVVGTTLRPDRVRVGRDFRGPQDPSVVCPPAPPRPGPLRRHGLRQRGRGRAQLPARPAGQHQPHRVVHRRRLR